MTRPPVRAAVEALMPRLKDDLARLVAIPSVSAPGYPESTRGPLLGAYDAVAELFREAGVGDVRPLELPDTAPIVTGEIPAPDGAPTVLLYSHYDVVPAGDESLWASPPFEATERDGAIFGRGTADARGPDRRSGAFRSGAQRPASSPPNQRCQIPPANPSLLRGEPTAIVAVFTARSRGWGLKAD